MINLQFNHTLMSSLTRLFVDVRVDTCLLLFSGLLFLSAQSQAFVLSGTSWANGEEDVIVDINTTNPMATNPPNIVAGGPTNSAFDAAYIEAADLWTNNSTFKYTVSTSGAVADPCAGSNSGVKFDTTPCSGVFQSSTLAVQTTSFSVPSNLNTRTVTVFNNLKQWDIYNGLWTGVNDFKRVAVHELGHGLGLDHSILNSIMYFQAGDVETPQADDISGAAALYDSDSDGIGIATDNCPVNTNAGQEDLDIDGQGDVCDGDIDGDGVFDIASVDVSHGVNPVGNSFFAAGPNSSNSAFPYIAQSFAAQITGNLERVDLPVYCPSGNVDIQIRTADTGVTPPTQEPTGTILATATFVGGIGVPVQNDGLVQFVLPSSVVVTSGSHYAIVINISGECRWISTTNFYAQGAGYLSTNASSWQFIGNFSSQQDFGFQTFINPVPIDNCPLIQNPLQEDSNSNGVGDACDTFDQDGDGIDDALDNCPADSNPLQENFDNDTEGDVCDADDDNDNLTDDDEVSIYGTNPFDADSDDDGFTDGEEVAAGTDPNVPNLTVTLTAMPGMWLLAMLLVVLGAARGRRVLGQID